MKRLAIIGAGGHGKEVADIAEASGWESISFFDRDWPRRDTHAVWKIQGDLSRLFTDVFAFHGIIVAIGDNAIRLSLTKKLLACKAPLISIIHAKAVISPYAHIGIGSIVFPNATIGPFTQIGIAAIIGPQTSISHDCLLKDGVHVSSHAALAGNVYIGEETWIGLGANVRQQTHIGKQAIVAAGAMVINAVQDHQTVIGIPAKEKHQQKLT